VLQLSFVGTRRGRTIRRLPDEATSCADAACCHILPRLASGGKAVDTLFTIAHTSRVSNSRFALLLLALAGLAVVLGPLVETRQRAPEGIARAYLRAVEQGDLEAALATIDPVQRDAERERVALQARNRYQIVTLVLGRPSLVDLLLGRDVAPAWVTVLADVTTVVGDRWRSTSTAPMVERDGIWYLTRPLFA
jgi:hypothetical protein